MLASLLSGASQRSHLSGSSRSSLGLGPIPSAKGIPEVSFVELPEVPHNISIQSSNSGRDNKPATAGSGGEELVQEAEVVMCM